MNRPISLENIDTDFFTTPNMGIDSIRDLAHAAVYWPLCDMLMEKIDQVCSCLEYMHENRERLCAGAFYFRRRPDA